MTGTKILPAWVAACGATMLAATFALDVALPAGVAVTIAYVAPVLLGLWAPRSRYALVTAVAATVLMTIAMVLEPSGVGGVGAMNNLFALLGIWSAALVTWWHGQTRAAADESARALSDYKDALDQAAIVAITDRRGLITYVNDKFCEISKYPREELVGQDHRILNSGYHPKEFMKDLWATIGRGRVWHGEIRNRAKDGSLYWVDTFIVPFVGEDGKPRQYVAIRTDITQKKVAQQALFEQEALARLGAMAAVVAHEVKNPLAGIGGALQIIGQRMPADAPEKPIVGEMLSRIAALDGMVSDLLQFARPRAPRLAAVEATELARETASLVGSDPALSALTIDVRGGSVRVMADADMLRQVLTNLLLNAAHAMGGAGRVSVAVEEAESAIEIRVSDEGPGVPADVRDRLYEPFFTTKSRGTGLGLPLARRHVESQGGTLELEDSPSGATFVVRIPRRKLAAPHDRDERARGGPAHAPSADTAAT